jgi:TAZ zinc finger
MAKKLEEVLYRSAKSFDEYIDSSTLTHRLQELAWKISERTKRMQKEQRQRLLLMQHAGNCQHQGGSCPLMPHCASMKRLWKHMNQCKNPNCRVPRPPLRQRPRHLESLSWVQRRTLWRLWSDPVRVAIHRCTHVWPLVKSFDMFLSSQTGAFPFGSTRYIQHSFRVRQYFSNGDYEATMRTSLSCKAADTASLASAMTHSHSFY